MRLPQGFSYHDLSVKKILVNGRMLVLTLKEEERKESAVIGSMDVGLMNSIQFSLALLYALAQHWMQELCSK
jgi:hypothetical protein